MRYGSPEMCPCLQQTAVGAELAAAAWFPAIEATAKRVRVLAHAEIRAGRGNDERSYRGIGSLSAMAPGLPSHPKDAEPSRRRWCVQAGGQRQREHAPAVDGVDDAIVPKPGRGIVGVALALVLRANR